MRGMEMMLEKAWIDLYASNAGNAVMIQHRGNA